MANTTSTGRLPPNHFKVSDLGPQGPLHTPTTTHPTIILRPPKEPPQATLAHKFISCPRGNLSNGTPISHNWPPHLPVQSAFHDIVVNGCINIYDVGLCTCNSPISSCLIVFAVPAGRHFLIATGFAHFHRSRIDTDADTVTIALADARRFDAQLNRTTVVLLFSFSAWMFMDV